MTDRKDFLLAEYNHIGQLLIESEQVGDRRVDFFLTLTTALIGALGLAENLPMLAGAVTSDEGNALLFFALLALLLYGLVTLTRIIRRNIITDEYKAKMNRIRRFFLQKEGSHPDHYVIDQDFAKYVGFSPDRDEIRNRMRTDWKDNFSLRTGGLIQSVSVLNAVIVGSISAVLLSPVFSPYIPTEYSNWASVPIGLIAVLIAWVVQMEYVNRMYKKQYAKSREPDLAKLIKNGN